MNFKDLKSLCNWISYQGQMDSNVTYVYVKDLPFRRLQGESDILYIRKTKRGKTNQNIRSRYKGGTRTNNTEGNDQNTNIRLTHVFGKLGLENCRCFYAQNLDMTLSDANRGDFLERLRTWDKRAYLEIARGIPNQETAIPLEKYLLVMYANDHLELPPMNNSF